MPLDLGQQSNCPSNKAEGSSRKGSRACRPRGEKIGSLEREVRIAQKNRYMNERNRKILSIDNFIFQFKTNH